MSIIAIMGACALIAGPLEAYTAHRRRPRVKTYRKPDAKYRHKKSVPAFHNRTLYSLYPF